MSQLKLSYTISKGLQLLKCDSVLMLKRLILKKLIEMILLITVLMGRIDEQAIDLKEIYIKTR